MITQTIEKAPRKICIEAIQGKQTFEEIDRLDNIAVMHGRHYIRQSRPANMIISIGTMRRLYRNPVSSLTYATS